jgi:hypothetical protein
MRIKCLSWRQGPAALDAVVTIFTARGQIEEVVVHRGHVNEGSLEVYYIGERDDLVFVELPEPTRSGRSRVWVPKSVVA